ncbi:MAG: tyrosine-type recombinase/integrase [Lachnospiraceae bacterium]|nr:tyrosine-type recombinase/integrase [Lachnospiraceae bacterium]
MGVVKRQDGRFYSRFTVNGKRYTVYGHTMKECREAEANRRAEIESGTYKAGSAVSLDDYFNRWIENKAATVKEATVRTDRILYGWIKAAPVDAAGDRFGALQVKNIEVQNVRDLQRNLKEGYTTKEGGRVRLSTRSCNDTLALLRSILKAATFDRIITFNPAEPVKPLKREEPAARDTIHRALTKEETAAFIRAARASWYYNLYVFLLNTGCRIGEAAALEVMDINRDTFRICRTVTRAEDGGYLIGRDTKTAAGRREIPILEEARGAVERQKVINAQIFGRVENLTDTIFRAPRGGIIKASCVNTDIQRICKAAGIHYFSVHALRDTFATRCIESGMQPKILQSIMGHSDISMTLNLYAHAMPQPKEQQLKAVNFI